MGGSSFHLLLHLNASAVAHAAAEALQQYEIPPPLINQGEVGETEGICMEVQRKLKKCDPGAGNVSIPLLAEPIAREEGQGEGGGAEVRSRVQCDSAVV